MFSRRSAAAEFPNDNPELHDGLVWQSDSVTGHALPTLRLRQLTGTLPKVIGPAWIEAQRRPSRLPLPVPVSAPVTVPVHVHAPVNVPAAVPTTFVAPDPAPAPQLAAPPADSEPAPAPAPEPELATPLADPDPESALATPSAFDALVAALVRVALDRGATRVAAELPALLSGARTPAGIADSSRAKALVARGIAWRTALDGGDLSGCGEQPLDLWASELLSTLLSAPGDREPLRRALRRHGVAAFGMLVAA